MANEKTPGDGKPISAWPSATNFTVAVPSDGPASILVSRSPKYPIALPTQYG